MYVNNGADEANGLTADDADAITKKDGDIWDHALVMALKNMNTNADIKWANGEGATSPIDTWNAALEAAVGEGEYDAFNAKEDPCNFWSSSEFHAEPTTTIASRGFGIPKLTVWLFLACLLQADASFASSNRAFCLK